VRIGSAQTLCDYHSNVNLAFSDRAVFTAVVAFAAGMSAVSA
jgi:hypothetical protein